MLSSRSQNYYILDMRKYAKSWDTCYRFWLQKEVKNHSKHHSQLWNLQINVFILLVTPKVFVSCSDTTLTFGALFGDYFLVSILFTDKYATHKWNYSINQYNIKHHKIILIYFWFAQSIQDRVCNTINIFNSFCPIFVWRWLPRFIKI